jgi:hypothetical protein
VVEQAKKMIEDCPNQKFVVHEFKADANSKVFGVFFKFILYYQFLTGILYFE